MYLLYPTLFNERKVSLTEFEEEEYIPHSRSTTGTEEARRTSKEHAMDPICASWHTIK
jgi:hypothetical protein